MRASERYRKYEVEDRRQPGFRLFLWAIALGVVGSAVFGLGLGAAFGRAGNWSNDVAEIGIAILIVAGVANLAALVLGLRVMIVQRVHL